MKKLLYLLILLVTSKNVQCFVITKGLKYRNYSTVQKHDVVNHSFYNKPNLIKNSTLIINYYGQ